MSKNQNNLQSLALRCAAVFAAGILAVASRAAAEVPQQINHQGVVSVKGERFDGTGAFRFAIVDPDTGVNLWTNDGTHEGEVGGVPDNAVSLPVAGGIYSVRLGDTGLAKMTPIPSSVFNDDNTVLRIWFDDGVNGNQQLTPDHELTAAPYAHRVAVMPPIGSIIAWHRDIKDPVGGADPLPLADGWVPCDGQTLSDPESPLNGQAIPDLNGAGSAIRRFLRGTSGISGGIENDATTLPNSGWTVNTHNHSHSVSSAAHSHTVDGHNPGGAQIPSTVEIGGSGDNADPPTSTHSHQHSIGSNAHNHTITGGDGETRPVNMSVVWIMRVK